MAGPAPVHFGREDALDDLVRRWATEPLPVPSGAASKSDAAKEWEDTPPFRFALRTAEASAKQMEDLFRSMYQWAVRTTDPASGSAMPSILSSSSPPQQNFLQSLSKEVPPQQGSPLSDL